MIRSVIALLASLFVAIGTAYGSPQTQPLDMQGYKINRLGQGVASTDAARMDQVPSSASIAGTGIVAKTGTSSFAARTITGPAAGISVSNGDGVAGNPTLSLSNDLSALEGLGSTGLAARTGTDTWAQRTITGPAAGITVTNGNGASGNPTLGLSNDLSALEGLSSTGVPYRTGTDTYSQYASSLGRNVIIGGNFDTNPWQRGTSVAGITSGGLTYVADRFFITNGTDGVATYARVADAPTVAQAGVFTSNSLKVSITTGDAAIAAGQYFTIGQKIEGYNFAQIAQIPTVLSFWVKAHRTGTYCIAARNGGGDRSLVSEYTINSADTWEFKQVAMAASPSAGTWSYTTGTGLTLEWTLAAGSTYQGTAASWQSANLLSSANQINGVAANTDTFQLALVQLEAGTFATPFELRSVSTELDLCKRYYEKSFPQGTTPATAAGYNGSAFTQLSNGTGMLMIWVQLSVDKRIAPTITTYNPINANAQCYDATKAADCSATGADTISTNSFRLYSTPPVTAANGDHVLAQWVANAEF